MRLSRKFFTSLFASTILVTQTTVINADDWDYWAIKQNADATGKGYDFYTVNNDTGEATLRDTKCWVMPNYGGICETGLSSDSAYVDPTSGDLWFTTPANEIYSYNLETDTWTDRGDEWRGNYTVVQPRSSVSNTSDGSINIGSGSDILLKKTSSGEYHIGQNSLVSKEESNTQKLWGTDANGDKIPINIVDSELQIDGTGVQSQITSNATNISSNDTDIASNSSNISSNDTDIASNASNISSNDTDIASNASNISSNDTDIASNASNISSNDTDIASNSSNISSNDTDISALQGLISTKSGSTTTARIGDSTKNTLEIGPTTNPTTIDQSGISVSGGNLIKKDSDGNIHIGKNSFVIGEDVLNGAHPIWAEDENGTKIPLNIYGSDLHINGKSVQGQIDSNKSNIKNIGQGVAGSTALTAALTALPQISKESKLSCGVGTGAYSSKYAVGFGCASKVNERVDINAGGSYVFGGSKSYGGGTLDSGVVKAGFIFKLGELNKPVQISMKDKKVMETKIGTLTEKNEKLQNTVSTLMARLERLEKIASKDFKPQDLASISD